MTTTKQLREWLTNMPDDASIGIDDRLALEAHDATGKLATFEVGCAPAPEENPYAEWPDDEGTDGYADLDHHDIDREEALLI